MAQELFLGFALVDISTQFSKFLNLNWEAVLTNLLNRSGSCLSMADVLVIKYNHTIQGDCDQDVVFVLVVTLRGQRGKKGA